MQSKSGIRLVVDPDKVRQARVSAFMTQGQVAEKANVGLSTVERLERGSEPVGVRYTTLMPIARVLGVSAEDLRSSAAV